MIADIQFLGKFCEFNMMVGAFKKSWMSSYVPTLQFRTGGSRFERTAPVLPFLIEISRFEMILACMSDIYEFFQSITLFTNSMWKSWLLLTKLRAGVALDRYLHYEQEIHVNKALIILAQSKGHPENLVWKIDRKSLKIDTVCNF